MRGLLDRHTILILAKLKRQHWKYVPILIELPYPDDREAFFAPLAGIPWAMWLDSAQPGVRGARQDLLAAFPRMTLRATGDEVCVREKGRERCEAGDPLEILARSLASGSGDAQAGGAAGYFAYDLSRRYVHLPALALDSEHIPDMAVGIYDGFVHLDHESRRCFIRARDTQAGARWAMRMASLLSGARRPMPESFAVLGDILPNMDFAAYARAFAAVQDYIRAGDCYQVNLAMRFAAPCRGHPWPLYRALRRRSPAPYAAWLNFPFAQVLSSSPESFLSLEEGVATTRPIKGTRPRSRDGKKDVRLAQALAASPKDRAENLMIVDLLRNDLGKVCTPGSIRVPELFRVESFATVHHLVSTVEGRLAAGRQGADLLAAAFPGGSITGAPKRRAMEIIESLEPQRRGVYCGAMGYMGFDGRMELNIAIRTLVCSHGEIRYWAGGGLVADSDVSAEYQECLDKGRAMGEVLEAFRHKTEGLLRIP